MARKYTAWSQVNRAGPKQAHMDTPCWVWTGCITVGYGQVWWEGRMRGAHVVAWELAHGPVPDGLQVNHECDHPPCVRHLHLGTPKSNMREAAARGRFPTGDAHWSRAHPERMPRGDRHGFRLHPETRPRGERHGCAVLTEDVVRSILAAAGETQESIARRVGISRQQVGRIIRRKCWAHVPEPT